METRSPTLSQKCGVVEISSLRDENNLLLHQPLCPQGDAIGVAFDDFSIGETIENTGLLSINGIVVKIYPVGDTGGYFAVDDGLLIA